MWGRMESIGVPRTQFASSLQSQMLGNERALGGSEEQQMDRLLFTSHSQTEPAFLTCTESYEARKGISQPCALKKYLFDSVHFPLSNKK